MLRDGIAVAQRVGDAHAAGEVPWTAVRLTAWAAADVETRRGEVLALLDGRIRSILEHTGGDVAPHASAPLDLPPAPAEMTAHGMEVVRPGGMLVAGGATLSARGLVKTYRKRRVVNEVDLQVSQGEIVGLLGPNGAGKTTSFYMMVGLIRPDKGKVFIGERNLTGIPMYRRARAGIGYLAQEPSIFRKLTVEENVMAILQMMKIRRAERKARLEQLLDELSIKHLRKTRAYALSGGERRRLEITRALVGNPKFMLLDEPFAGVDPIAVHDIQQIVSDLRRRGIGVLISDHNVEQTLDIVDRAYIMYDGRVRVSGTVSELVWNEEVAEIYLGPTLTARMRERYPNPADERSAAHDPRFGAGSGADGGGSLDTGGFGSAESFGAVDAGDSVDADGRTGFGAAESLGAGAHDGVAADARGAVDEGRPRESGPLDGFEEDRTLDAGVADGGSGLTGLGSVEGLDEGGGIPHGGNDVDARAADFGDFAVGGGRHAARADDGLAVDGGGGDERDGAGDQPDASQDHTRNPREGEAA